MKFTLIIFLFFSLIIVSNAQQKKDTIYKAYIAVQNEEIEFHSVKKIEYSNAKEFQGSYHFGDSEAESDLDIIFSNSKLYAKTEYSIWENETWIGKTDRVSIKYDNGKIITKEGDYETEFFIYECIDNSNLFLKKGTKGIGFAFTENENNQIYHYIQFNEGQKIITIGKYPEASFVKLTNSDLLQYSKDELKIVRNEIFARNGYIFKEGGKMDNYFSNKDWYNSIKKTSNPNLSDIEKYNVNLILRLEKQ